MPRPNKLNVPTRTFNCILTREQYDRLCDLAGRYTETSDGQVSVSDLIRIAVSEFIDDRA